MSALVLTADEKTLLDAVDSLVDDAFADGVEYPAATQVLAPLPGYGDPRSRPHLPAIRGPFLAALLALNREAGAAPSPLWDPVERWGGAGGRGIGNWVNLSGSYTVGAGFQVVNTSLTVTGVKFYRGYATSYTYKVTLWNPSGIAVATGTTTISGAAGIYTVNFATPYAIPLGQQNRTFVVSVWETSGTETDAIFNGPALADTIPTMGSPNVQLAGFNYYAAGDAYPTTLSAVTRYAVTPVFA